MTTADDILDFWLVEIGEKGWYEQSDSVDQAIRNRFLPAWEAAETLTHSWQDSADGALAGLILTDQFPRNMFRGDPRAFATDPLAVRLADAAINLGQDLAIPTPQRQFFYMPYEHAEDLDLQNRAIALFSQRMPGESLEHAELHRDTIARFGRFPWRNAALGRTPTAAEDRVMAAGGYGALVSGKLSLADPGEMV